MDPISLGTAAAGLVRICAKLTGQLYTFISRARIVDESLQTLRFEIDSLSGALTSIRLSFEDPLLAEVIVNSQARHERRHWQNVRQSLDHCLNTLTRLEGILDNVESCEGQFLINARRRLRMDMRSGEMLILKEQIASCRGTLQLSLQLITVSSLLKHGVANTAISSRLDTLMEEMQTFRIEFRDRFLVLATEQHLNPNDTQVMNNLDDCVRSAEAVATVAATIISTRSTYLSQTLPGSHSRRQLRDRTAAWVENHVREPGLAEAENELISSVTSETAAQPITPSPSTVASTVVRVQSLVTRSMTTTGAGLRGTENVFPEKNHLFDDVDFFEDVQPELIRAWLKEGKSQFELGNYDDAGEYMRTVVTHARAIEYEGKAENLDESMNLLAKCYCNMDELHNAETTLLELLNDNTRTLLQQAESKHELADVYLTRQNYASAEERCREAIQIKSRILSRNHDSVHISIGLLVHILEAKGSEHVAAGYKTLLPREMRTSQAELALIEEMSKRITVREALKSQLHKIKSENRQQAVCKFGGEYFNGLIPRKPCMASRQGQWEEVRANFVTWGLNVSQGGRYSLVHACAEYGHEILLSLLLELTPFVDIYDGYANTALARAVIGHENGLRVPASISRILLEHGNAFVGAGVNSEGVYASRKQRSSPQSILNWAKNGSWPWPETKDLVIEKGRKQGLS